MLFRTLIAVSFVSLHKMSCGNAKEISIRPYTAFPVPFELPYRNERSEQCWLRVEDVELTETVAVFCYIAHGFLSNYIAEYNSRKMNEDDVDVSVWNEDPTTQDDSLAKPAVSYSQKDVKDWKLTTILDPITRMRLYVSRQAVCRLIMYNREAMTNYQVECEKLLYYVNSRMNGGSKICEAPTVFATILLVLLVFGL